MAPTKPRGRAKQSDSPSTAAAIPDPAAFGAPGKRGRGRPPKDPSGLPQRVLNPKISKGVGRRGRPPKDPNAPKKTPVKAKAAGTPGSTGRGRGRPPKGGGAAALGKALEGSAKKGGSKVARGGPGQARGRAAKAAAAAAAGEDEENEEFGEGVGVEGGLGEEELLGEGDVGMSDADADADADEDDEEDGGAQSEMDTFGTGNPDMIANGFLQRVGRTFGF